MTPISLDPIAQHPHGRAISGGWNLVVYKSKIRTVHSKPLILLLIIRQLHSVTQIATAKRCFGMLVQIIALCALGETLLGLEGLVVLATAHESE